MFYYLNFGDYIIAPFYIILFYLIVKKIANKRYKSNDFDRKMLIRGFWVKVIAAIAYAMFIQYYYGGGDTFRYFGYSRIMHQAINNDFSNITLLFSPAGEFYKYAESLPVINEYKPANQLLTSEANVMVMRISCILGYFCFQKYLVVSILFSLLSYMGIWKMYRVFSAIFSYTKKSVAFSFLFLPSFVFWGSGILKETVCLFALGYLLAGCYNIFIQKKVSIAIIVKIIAFGFIIFLTKKYIFFAFALSFSVWVILNMIKKLKSRALRKIVTFFFVFASIAVIFVFSSSQLEGEIESQKEAILDNVSFYSDQYQKNTEDAGSAAYFNLGDFDPSISGLIKKVPYVLMSIFFRPFVWEAKSIVLFISMLESFYFLLLFLAIMYKSKIFGFFSFVFKNEVLVFCFIMSIVFGLIVGFTTFNFGSIIRYKIPCMPFFSTTLLIAYHHFRHKKTYTN